MGAHRGTSRGMRYLGIGNALRYEQDARVATFARPVGQDHEVESEGVAEAHGLHGNRGWKTEHHTVKTYIILLCNPHPVTPI